MTNGPVTGGKQETAVTVSPSDPAGGLGWGMLEAVVDGSPEAIVGVARDGTIRVWNDAAKQLYGYTAQETLGHPAREVLTSDPQNRDLTLARAFAGEEIRDVEKHTRSKSGEALETRLTVVPVRSAAGEIVGIVGISRDLRAQRQVERELLAKLDQIVRYSPTPILAIGVDRRIRAWNAAAERLFGYTAAEAVGQLAPQLLAADPAEREVMFTRVLEGHVYNEVEVGGRTKSGAMIDIRLTLAPIHDPAGAVVGIVAFGRDLSTQRRVERELLHHLDHDWLTGLYNRRRLIIEIERCLAFNRSLGVEGALLTIDIDDFNIINDSDGRAGGDRLLLFVADMLRSYAREADIVARIGGDEFVLILPEASAADAQQVAAEIRGRLRAYPEGPIRASIGLATCSPDPDVSADDLLAAADMALHDAEAAGGDRAVLFESSAGSALKNVERIRSALAEGRLLLHGQPIISLADGTTKCHELLVRMVDHDGELVPPGEFIPAAERFGLIHDIDLWVTSRALRMAAHGRRVGVNLSGASIGDPELLQLITNAARAGVPVENVIFEITETAAIDRLPQAVAFSEALEQIGASIALDDFGTGFGSFTYLKHIRSRFVKIDVEFVRELVSSQTDREVVRSIVNVAHALGKLTIAEGIEDGCTLEAVRGLGVDYAQGYHVGRPAPLPDL